MHLETWRFSRQKDTSRDTGMHMYIFRCKPNLIFVIIPSVFLPFCVQIPNEMLKKPSAKQL